MTKFDKKVFVNSLLMIIFFAGIWWWNSQHKPVKINEKNIFYISSDGLDTGRLSVANYENFAEKEFISSPTKIINQFVLSQVNNKRILFYLAADKSEFQKNQEQLRQNLFSYDLETGKKRKISIPPKTQISQMFSSVVNKSIYFEAETEKSREIWKYSLLNKKWQKVPAKSALQSIDLSEQSQLMLAVNPNNSFGYVLLSLESPGISQPIGNFYQGFGFSPSGQKILFKQKPNQDIFSETSYLVVFSADGTSQNFLENRGEIINATWGKNDQEIFVVMQNENYQQELWLLNLAEKQEKLIKVYDQGNIMWLNFKKDKLWFVVEEKNLNAENENEFDNLLENFAHSYVHHFIYTYDPVSDRTEKEGIEGFSPLYFSS